MKYIIFALLCATTVPSKAAFLFVSDSLDNLDGYYLYYDEQTDSSWIIGTSGSDRMTWGQASAVSVQQG